MTDVDGRSHPGATRAQLHRKVDVLVRDLHARTLQLRHQGAIIALLRDDHQGRDGDTLAERNLVRANEGLIAELAKANGRIAELSQNLDVTQDRVAMLREAAAPSGA